jgi:prepilin-type N-terminal cleavage/methylation domain-containing protein
MQFLSRINKQKGFTLIELMVSVSIFSVVMVMCMGSILSVLDANRKSQSLRAVLDNLNFAVEGMNRVVRFGDRYHCGSGGDITQPTDCQSGDSFIALRDINANQVIYKLVNSRIVRSVGGGGDQFITSPDITIEALTFAVVGTNSYASGDTYQPKVAIIVKGYASPKPSIKSSFVIQTTASQRKIDQ